MASLVIRNIPEQLHQRLKAQATQHHRSMNKEVISLLEEALCQTEGVREMPPPYKGNIALTTDFIDKAKKEGRS